MTETNQNSSSTLLGIDSDQNDPWLLISQGNTLQNHAFYSISKNKLISTNIPDFRNRMLSSTSHHGWLASMGCAGKKSRSRLDCCLLNISTGEKVELPSIHIQPGSSWSYRCILSKPPTDPTCHVMFFPTADDGPVLYCRPGDEKFRSKDMGYSPFDRAANFGGRIYIWMFCSNKIVEVDFVEGGGDMILNESVDSAGEPLMIETPMNFSRNYMVDCCGELLLVSMICDWNNPEDIAYVRMHKINVADGEVSELKSIGDRVIFIGIRESTSISCGDGDLDGDEGSLLKRNSIYYTFREKFLYVYDIEDRSRTLVKLCPIKRYRESMMSWITV